jgi:hypothetical protein
MTMMLMTVPLFSTVLPPLFDYPNHLARLYFVDGGRQCILRRRAMGAAAKPRARSDRAAARGSDAARSRLKLFLVMVFGLIAGGAIWLNRVATGAWD